MSAALAVLVLALSWPRLGASLRYLPVDFAIARYYRGEGISTERLPVLLDYAEEALAHEEHYRYRDGLSLLYFVRAVDIYTPALERRDAYRDSAREAETSLAEAPAQPATWLRLALVRWILRDEPESILAAWKMSIFTGRTDSSLYARRVEIGLALATVLDAEARAMLTDQLLLGWRNRPRAVAEVLWRRDRELSQVRELLEGVHPAVLEEMEARLDALR